MAVKYVFVTGGVVSGLGKGITAASLGRLLKARGYTVTMQKFDPYINIDPGTMNPVQHGEVFVTDDGAETDLDLGHYERFIDENLQKIPMSQPERFIGLSYRRNEEVISAAEPCRLSHTSPMRSKADFTEILLLKIQKSRSLKWAELSVISKASLSWNPFVSFSMKKDVITSF